jgi:glutathione-specific gamma-glutamylcyclotransferase
VEDYPPVFKNHSIDQHGLWIFGYGSLMWRPGFEYVERHSATLQGYHRAFCLYSHHHRGTPETPGLVLGLDQGENCLGVAFRVTQESAREVVAYLDERELIGYAYTPKLLEISLEGEMPETSRRVTAYTFVADFNHANYAGEMEISQAAKLIMDAEGVAGLNRDYLMNTVRHLEQVGSVDTKLHSLLEMIEHLTGAIEMGSGI